MITKSDLDTWYDEDSKRWCCEVNVTEGLSCILYGKTEKEAEKNVVDELGIS